MEVEGSAFTPGLAAGSAGGVVKDLFGEELPAVPPDSDEEPSVKTLHKAMQKMDSNLGGKIDRVQEQFESIQIQFKDLKETCRSWRRTASQRISSRNLKRGLSLWNKAVYQVPE
jgi:hypothetical protein